METKRALSDPLVALKMLALCEDLTLAERRVAAALLDHRNHRTGRCDPSLETISRELRINLRTVIRANAALMKKDLVQIRRHGGHFHRNSYGFNWERFRERHDAWARHRASVSRKDSSQNLSPCTRQARHLEGGNETTQTCLSNQLKETYADAPSSHQHGSRNTSKRDGDVEEGTGKLEKRTGKTEGSNAEQLVANGRFHVKTTPPREVLRHVAMRRWNDDLLRRYAGDVDDYANAIDAIDDDLSREATDAEVAEPGGGLALILQRIALQRRGAAS